MSTELFEAGVLHGLILAFIAFGVMIPFRFLNFPDLTAEGAYPLGAAIYATLINCGTINVVAMLCAAICSGLMAIGTSQIAFALRINSLLAGIILSTMSYSINLRILGKPNIPLVSHNMWEIDILFLSILISTVVLIFGLFLYTDFGLRFRTIAVNPKLASNLSISINKYTSLGLFIAGAMFGLAGSLMVAIQQFMDIGMGVGIVIHGLASLMIGESILGQRDIPRQLIAPLIGALVYQQIQGVALSCGLAPSDLKMFTGGIVLIVLAIKRQKYK